MSGGKRRRSSDESPVGNSSKQSRHADDPMEKISLPVSIDLETFVSSRKDELANLANVVKVKMRKLVSQQLPRHLRRRAVSHNKKRLPKRLQARFNAEGAKETKRPSRLHRRRPRNLQQDYERRSRENRWLETHIWHAKRFRMVNSFGYRIPESSFDKSLRACYRGASKFCLLNDVSYECCIQLEGTEENICAILNRYSSAQVGLRVGAKKFIEGNLQGSIWLYQADSYPYDVIGEVTFMWRPRLEDSDERTLWIWCHPELREILLNAFDETLKPADGEEARSTAAGVRVKDLRDELNRFRLTGPLAVRTLCETLTQDTSGLETNLKIKASYYNPFWETLEQNSLSASSFLKDGQIVGNVVLDPRLHMPTKRLVSSVVGTAEDAQNADFYSPGSTEIPVKSDVWDIEVRKVVKEQMLTQDEINKLRQKNLVPGTALDLKEKESRIPIMVVFRSGSKDRLGYGRGCDIIIPSGWGRQFFIALNYRGARAAGLRDLNAVTRCGDKMVFPDDVPDSAVAKLHLDAETEKLRVKHFTYPPNKRTAFFKISTFQPYAMPFQQLIESYSDSPRTPTSNGEPEAKSHRPFVIRDRNILEAMSRAEKGYKFGTLGFRFDHRLFEGLDLEAALVPVKLISVDRGAPQRFARIYVVPSSMRDCILDENVQSFSVTEAQHHKDIYDTMTMNAATDNLFGIVGFITSAETLMGKTSTALGYVSVNGLRKLLLENPSGIIAYRNQNVVSYRKAHLQFIV